MSSNYDSNSSILIRHSLSDTGAPKLILSGNFTLNELEKRSQLLSTELSPLASKSNLHWDLTGIKQMDDTGALLLWRIWGEHQPPFIKLRREHEKIFNRIENTIAISQLRPQVRFNPIRALGETSIVAWGHLVGIITLTGQLLLDTKYLFSHPSRTPWREISATLFRTGAQALGITALVGFLIGIVLSYLSSKQLQTYGADIFIINILGISIIRELGPMLAAILVAGRSGSSMTAQLGVMRVTEELDALAVMGIPHSLRLILPKVIGLSIAMPLLVIWTSSIALMGGMVSAEIQLGLGYQFFLNKLSDVVPIANLWIGLGKGVVCGIIVALISCHFGLKIKSNTESLGEGTTTSVVTAITTVIIIDAIFAIIFANVGLI
ncbi:MAG: ABC transporter permease [Nitrosomonadaceae bacterium]|nr:ABC transporter permease [Nitrosomonadaceae bacterium]|tara:strand:+ start:1798 stop:2934 length:1137 start_codon:yes stop_codon:yes gene_type:complete